MENGVYLLKSKLCSALSVIVFFLTGFPSVCPLLKWLITGDGRLVGLKGSPPKFLGRTYSLSTVFDDSLPEALHCKQ